MKPSTFRIGYPASCNNLKHFYNISNMAQIHSKWTQYDLEQADSRASILTPHREILSILEQGVENLTHFIIFTVDNGTLILPSLLVFVDVFGRYILQSTIRVHEILAKKLPATKDVLVLQTASNNIPGTSLEHILQRLWSTL